MKEPTMSVIEAHRHSIHHRAEIEASEICGCFYCLEMYPASAITEWTDKENDTALCPTCGIDAVVGSASGLELTTPFLEAMRRHWF